MSTLPEDFFQEGELFELVRKHAKQALGPKGWNVSGPILYLVNACLNLHGIQSKIVGQWVLAGVGVTGKPISKGQNYAIEYPNGRIFDAHGLQGWDSIWNKYQQLTGSGDWAVDQTKIQAMSPSDLLNFRRQLKGVVPAALDAMAPSVLSAVQEALLQLNTEPPALSSRPGARL